MTGRPGTPGGLGAALGRVADAEQEPAGREHELDRVREELEAERQRYEQLFELSPFACLVTDEHGTIRKANRAASALLGVRGRYATGKPLAIYLPPGERRSFRHSLLTMSRRPPPTRVLLSLRSRSGQILPGAATVAIGYDRDGSVECITWLVRPLAGEAESDAAEHLSDVLEELVRGRTAELTALSRALERDRGVLEQIVEQMPFGVLVVDAVTRRPTIANQAFHELVGDPRSLPRFRDPDGEIVPTDRLPLSRSLERGETMTSVPLSLRRDDGRAVHLEASSAPVLGGGRTVAAVATFHDVETRERRERAEREFVANAAHGLQNPLTVIGTAVEILQSGAKEVPAERDRFLAHVERETRRLTRLTRSLLTLARVQTGAEGLRLRVTQLAPLLDAVASQLAPAEAVRVEVRCPADLGLVTNAELLEEAIANLAENAVKYTEEGRVSLTAELARDDLARIGVSDTGRGIPADRQELIFGRFERGGDVGPEGFGLGLAIVREIVAVLGAEIEVSSDAGTGTTFSLELPALRIVTE